MINFFKKKYRSDKLAEQLISRSFVRIGESVENVYEDCTSMLDQWNEQKVKDLSPADLLSAASLKFIDIYEKIADLGTRLNNDSEEEVKHFLRTTHSYSEDIISFFVLLKTLYPKMITEFDSKIDTEIKIAEQRKALMEEEREQNDKS